MTNPTHEEIIEAQLARQWAEQVQQSDAEYERKGRRYSGDPMRAAAEFILAHTGPPTMADVEWDDDKHFLAEANHPTWGRSAMLRLDKDEWIEVISWDEDGPAIHSAIPYYLVPTGKRYELKEMQE